MRKDPTIKLKDLVSEQEKEAIKLKRERIAKLVGEKIQRRERIKEQILDLKDELKTVEETIAHLKKEDWKQIDWKHDSSDEA